MNSLFRIAALLLAMLGFGQAHAQFTVYTDRGAWQTAVSGYALESFSDGAADGFSIVEVGSGHSFGIDGGRFQDRVVNDSTYTVYAFDTPINAFGADWDLSPGGAGQGLRLVVDGLDVSGEIFNGHRGFFGFTANFLFDTLVVFAGTQPGTAETHDVDNVVYGSAAPVPEPSTYLLMIAGLLAIGFIVGRRMK
jgi:hypothetical protein